MRKGNSALRTKEVTVTQRIHLRRDDGYSCFCPGVLRVILLLSRPWSPEWRGHRPDSRYLRRLGSQLKAPVSGGRAGGLLLLGFNPLGNYRIRAGSSEHASLRVLTWTLKPGLAAALLAGWGYGRTAVGGGRDPLLLLAERERGQVSIKALRVTTSLGFLHLHPPHLLGDRAKCTGDPVIERQLRLVITGFFLLFISKEPLIGMQWQA